MKNFINWFLNPPETDRKNILILRFMAGGVFFWEGVLKFVYPNQGVGRFTKLGFPLPGATAHFVAVTEMAGGLLLIFGLLTRIVAFYFMIEMIVDKLSTKISLYLGTSPLPLPGSSQNRHMGGVARDPLRLCPVYGLPFPIAGRCWKEIP
jgi:putative oxidoreductase